MSKNTLFKYFSKTPPATKPSESPVTPKSAVKCNGKLNGTPASHKKGRPEKKVPDVDYDDEGNPSDHTDEELTSPVKKRRRILMVDSDDSEDEYKPGKKELESSESDVSEELSDHESQSSEDLSEEENSTPKRKKKPDSKQKNSNKRPRNGQSKTNGYSPITRSIVTTTPPSIKTSPPSTPASTETKSKLSLFAAKQTQNEKTLSPESAEDGKIWTHLTYKFLQPAHIMDANRRRPEHPEYNPRTLYISEDFKRSLTPAMRQWWEIKSHHFDCVLFFKVGKFYELYHMDAVIGVNELNISFMKGEFAHSGFPEIAYSRFAPLLVEKGYQVARIEQTETPNLMEERCKSISRPTKFDRVVKRELCQITTRGTRTFNVADGDACGVAGSHFLLALTEKSVAVGSTFYGVCFVDTTIGSFYIGQFEDDRHCSRLRTMLAHYPPVQVLYERGALSPKTSQLLASPSCPVPPGLQTSLHPGTEFWDAQKTLKTLMDGKYFVSKNKSDASGHDYWPPGLSSLISEDDPLGLTPRNDSELAIQSLGALTWYLQRCCIDQQLYSMRTFQIFTPVDTKTHEPKDEEPMYKFGRFMVLDGITIENLDLLSDSDCSLMTRLNNCCTAFGQRLLRQWVSAPLCDIHSILLRQGAIDWLLSSQGQRVAKEAKEKLAGLPDLERVLSSIHSQGNEAKSKTHPDSRAIFYEDKIYSKRRINDFLATLGGFKALSEVAEIFEGVDCESKFLMKLTHTKETSPVGMFPDLKPLLKFFDEAFNHNVAKQEGRIIPIQGVDSEYDSALEDIADVQKKVDEHLEEQRGIFKCKVTYFGTERKRYQIEVPDHACKYATDDHSLQSQRKGFKRYYTSEAKELLEEMMAAEDRKAAALRDLSRKIFAQFSNHNFKWAAAVECMATLDVLMSLAEHTRSQEGETCVPKFFKPSSTQKPFISIQEGRHPCILLHGGFIPNDIHIGPRSLDDSSSNKDMGDKTLILVTGPNMGGKSTLMRLAGLITIMAQMGCHVPAASCQLTPADRIFTRLGANDRIGEGESTFCVEMSETASILRHATPHSLVLMDELGRGTATYDGTAIAASVVKELSTMGCRTLFSTHYHSLVTEFGKSAGVALGHMACMVETDDIDEDDDEEAEGQERVTFLYKFTPGACPKSYGFHVARLAGIPKSVISSALKAAKEMEMRANARKALKAFCALSINDTNLKETMTKILECS